VDRERVLALLIGGVAAAAQRALMGSQAAEIQRDLDEVEEDVEEVARDVDEIEEDVERLLKGSQDLSETDRVILRELQSINRRLDNVRPER
jgi:uncharacterized protein YoxC